MTYFPELSEYEYLDKRYYRPGTKNVGWLAAGHEFDVAPPTEELLDRLWRYCKVSIAALRGFHRCDFCLDASAIDAAYKGERLMLGTSEIRVFGESGEIFAAPTLIFHYVRDHHYRPPEAFVSAVMRDPAPPDPAYFARLQQVQLKWTKTWPPSP